MVTLPIFSLRTLVVIAEAPCASRIPDAEAPTYLPMKVQYVASHVVCLCSSCYKQEQSRHRTALQTQSPLANATAPSIQCAPCDTRQPFLHLSLSSCEEIPYKRRKNVDKLTQDSGNCFGEISCFYLKNLFKLDFETTKRSKLRLDDSIRSSNCSFLEKTSIRETGVSPSTEIL